MRHYALKRFSWRQIDVFLWLAGKDSFPRKYGNPRDNNGDAAIPFFKVPMSATLRRIGRMALNGGVCWTDSGR
jgi:hypothetical protein